MVRVDYLGLVRVGEGWLGLVRVRVDRLGLLG